MLMMLVIPFFPLIAERDKSPSNRDYIRSKRKFNPLYNHMQQFTVNVRHSMLHCLYLNILYDQLHRRLVLDMNRVTRNMFCV